ncbi:MAG: hypothetical protein Q4D21_06780 [Phascolarctobacterium sp.]|nr:hypothetical protein [Phascolarctobacterium sp.]
MEYEGLGFDYKKIIKRRYIFYSCFGALIVLFSYFRLVDRYANAKEISKGITEKKTMLRTVERFKTQHQDIEVYKMQLKKANEEIKAQLPNRYDEQEFLKSLHECCGSSIKINNVVLPRKQDIVTPKNEKGLSIYVAKVQVQGDYFDILNFVRELERRHFLVQNFKLKADKIGFLDVSMNVGKYIVQYK